MLFLTRRAKQNEDTILIGDDIKVVVRRVGLHQVRIGVEAPEEIKILRGEHIDGNRKAR